MVNKRFLKLALTLVALVAVFGVSNAMAQEGDQGPVATMVVEQGKITWQPHVEYAGLVLTVSGPDGFEFRQEFDAGKIPTFRLNDQNGNRLPDGPYKYELVVGPVIAPDVLDSLRAVGQENREVLMAELQASGDLPKESLVQSGSWLVKDGEVLSSSALESTEAPISPLDLVHLDDVIVVGSLCVGDDCVNGESFGFDTIRLKENNLRIKFQDTSSSASFPSNDWQITANDSANGGLNKFSIDDIDGGRTPFTIEAGAPSHSLYVDDGGRVGFGTSTPVVLLHTADGNTPTVRLEQDGSSGFTPQTWDVAGNEANFFIRDATNGSTLPFRIRPNAPTSSIEIVAGGNVGIGTSSPSERLHVAGNVQVDGHVTENSDVKAKANFDLVEGEEILTRLAAIPITTWNFKNDDPSIRHMGPTAQDFYGAFGLGKDDRHIAALDVNGIALVSIQELNNRLQEKDAQIADLEARLKALEQNVGVEKTLTASLSIGSSQLWPFFGVLLLAVAVLSRGLAGRR